jgi:heme/copper-type cytochrome/quinol oxidase subunit 3
MAAEHAAAAHDPNIGCTGLDHRKMGMWAFLGSECMFFGSLIATYLVYRGRDTVGPHPHEMFDIPLTSYSAFLLLMSSLTMVLSLAAIQRGNLRGTKIWLAVTALLGMHFIGNQVYEFTTFVREGLKLQTNLFGSTFEIAGLYWHFVDVVWIAIFTLVYLIQ